MLAPSVDGTRGPRYRPLATLVVGTTLGGILLSVFVVSAWSLFQTSEAARLGLVLALGLFAAVTILIPSIRKWIPETGSQVRGELLQKMSVERAALRWGVELGLGVRSFVVTPGFYALVAVAVAQSSGVWAALVPVVYGFSRGSAIAAFAVVTTRRRVNGNDAMPGVGLERALRIPLAVVVGLAVLQTGMPA